MSDQKSHKSQRDRVEEMPQALIGSELLEEENEIKALSAKVRELGKVSLDESHAPMETLMPITPGEGEGISPATKVVRGDD